MENRFSNLSAGSNRAYDSFRSSDFDSGSVEDQNSRKDSWEYELGVSEECGTSMEVSEGE